MYFLNHHMPSVKSFAVLQKKKIKEQIVSEFRGVGLWRGERLWKCEKKITRNV